MFLDEKKQGEAQTKADPFTLESLIAWLEKQPAATPYDYTMPDACLAAQFLQSRGFAGEYCSVSFLHRSHGHGYGEWLHQVVRGGDRTFGAALKRARHLQARS